MTIVLQSLKNGQVFLGDAPAPAINPHQLLVRTEKSLISSGTEKMLMEFGEAGWLGKARMQPERVRHALSKARTDGPLATFQAIQARLDQPLSLGYCNIGRVVARGNQVSHLQLGDRVVSNGNHASMVAVGANLCLKIPDQVSDELACFTIPAAIALQGIRLAAPMLGETIAVIGLGLIGLLGVQILRAQGCHVIGFDPDPIRVELARQFGAHAILLDGSDAAQTARRHLGNQGADAVLVTAASQTSEPLTLAAEIARERGRIVLIGATGMRLERSLFYAKELSFQVSRAYGPGRYDKSYEHEGRDYPQSHVRWTAGRNMQAVLDLMQDGRLDCAPLVSHRFDISNAKQAYEILGNDRQSLGIILTYPTDTDPARRGDFQRRIFGQSRPIQPNSIPPRIGFIGAGNHAFTSLLPALRSARAKLQCVASHDGVKAYHAAQRFGFADLGVHGEAILSADNIDAVIIATRNSNHADLTCRALLAGKHVYIEKPLALNVKELEQIKDAWTRSRHYWKPPLLMVGFNRRFAPHILSLREAIQNRSAPPSMLMVVNAPQLPLDHWLNHPAEGGPLLGEACHFIDLLRHLAAAPIRNFRAHHHIDQTMLDLSFESGATGTVHIFSNGSRHYPKERIEVFCDGAVARLDNFRRLSGFGWKGLTSTGLLQLRQDKGGPAAIRAFLDAITDGGEPPIPIDEIFETALVTIQLAEEFAG